MSTFLHAASSQWAERPADERFWNLGELKAACQAARDGSAASTVALSALRAESHMNDVCLVGPSGKAAHFTHYAFGQLAQQCSAPADYLRRLPAPVAAQALTASIQATAKNPAVTPRNLLFHKNGGLTLRACLSARYDRVWDSDVANMLERLDGWRAPAGRCPPDYKGATRPATAGDILPGQINIVPGDAIAPSGLYASDHDMFAFLVAPDRVISDGAGGALMRGIFVRNSEVGDASLSVTFFLMQAVCGNHIVWNATGVHEIRVRHVGEHTMRRAFRGFEAELWRYHDAAAEEEKGIIVARRMVLGQKKEDVLEALVKYAKSRSLPLSRTRLGEAYDVAADHEDWYGPPNTLWGVVAGLTHASQAGGYADDRAATDRAAGKLLAMAF
jgi:hypothetical protein